MLSEREWRLPDRRSITSAGMAVTWGSHELTRRNRREARANTSKAVRIRDRRSPNHRAISVEQTNR
jgi:hypothetical protein